MKYRDLITIFAGVLFFLSLAYTIGVDFSVWYLPIITFLFLGIVIYKLWIT